MVGVWEMCWFSKGVDWACSVAWTENLKTIAIKIEEKKSIANIVFLCMIHSEFVKTASYKITRFTHIWFCNYFSFYLENKPPKGIKSALRTELTLVYFGPKKNRFKILTLFSIGFF